MSNALSYLLKVRPEAMRSYFDFIKQSGGHLDKKTRAIISVITKVDNQTETGLKQYLVRALQLGVTPDEIIDALFVAFPTLGLSKIIWAVDIILEMDIPEFRPEELGHKPDWHRIAPLAELNQGITRLEADGRELFIYKENRESLKVYDSHCPHQVTNIPALAVSGDIMTCPKHGWKFDIKSGECIEKGDRPLKKYEHKIEDNHLYCFW